MYSIAEKKDDPTESTHLEENMCNLEKLPKYIDCQETLTELSFIKWLAGFRLLCRDLTAKINKDIVNGLLIFFQDKLLPEVIDCRNKVNKSNLVKTYLSQSLLFFRTYYGHLRQDLSDTIYLEKMASLLAYYIDLELMSSQRYNGIEKKISNKIIASLSLYLSNASIDFTIDSIFQSYYIFYGTSQYGYITRVMLKKILYQPIPSKIEFFTYLRLILCCKLWKKIICVTLKDGDKRREQDDLRKLLRKIHPPSDFMKLYQKFKWPNWPKLTMSQNGTNDMSERDRQNISTVLFNANLSLKECFKDILDVKKETNSNTMKSIIKRCKQRCPAMSEIFDKSENVIQKWSNDFDEHLKPLIPVTGSWNSLLRKIKYNFEPQDEPESTGNDESNNGEMSNEQSTDDDTFKDNLKCIMFGPYSETKKVEEIELATVIVNRIPFTYAVVNDTESRRGKKRRNSHSPSNPKLPKISFLEDDSIESKSRSQYNNNSCCTAASVSQSSTKQGNAKSVGGGGGGSSNDSICGDQSKNAQNVVNNAVVSSDFSGSKSAARRLADERRIAASAAFVDLSNENDSNSSTDDNHSHLEIIEKNIDNLETVNSNSQASEVLSNEWDCNQEDADSSESQHVIDSPDQIEIETPSSDIEPKSPKDSSRLSLRSSSAEMNSTRRSPVKAIGKYAHAMPMHQQEATRGIEHGENEINSNTQDLEVVNVLSPVSINSTDIAMNKGPSISDLPIIHAQNNRSSNDTTTMGKPQISVSNLMKADVDHHHGTVGGRNNEAQATLQQKPVQVKSMPMLSSNSCSFGQQQQMDDRRLLYDVDDKMSIRNCSSASAAYELHRSLSAKSGSSPTAAAVSSTKLLAQSLNDTNTISSTLSSINTINLHYSNEKISMVEMCDDFSDNSMDIQIPNVDSEDIVNCPNSISMSTCLKPMFNNFKQLGPAEWPTVKTSEQLYPESMEIVSMPLRSRSEMPLHSPQSYFLGDDKRSPQQQVYYGTAVNNGGGSSDQFENRRKRATPHSAADEYVYSTKVQRFDNSHGDNRLLTNGYAAVPIASPVTSKTLYDYVALGNSQTGTYDNSSELHNTADGPSPTAHHNNELLNYRNLNYSPVPNLLLDGHHRQLADRRSSVINGTDVMMPDNSNGCNIHYRWPVGCGQDGGGGASTANHRVLYAMSSDDLSHSVVNIVVPKKNLNPSEKILNAATYQQFQDVPNVMSSAENSIAAAAAVTQSSSAVDPVDDKRPARVQADGSLDLSSPKNRRDHPPAANDGHASSENQTADATGAKAPPKGGTNAPSPYEGMLYLYERGKLYLCMYPYCTNGCHYPITQEVGEKLRHEFTVQFDFIRFQIQFKYNHLLQSDPKDWLNIPELVRLDKRCLCEICGEMEYKINFNQNILLNYVNMKKSEPFRWKKCLVNRFNRTVTDRPVSEMIDDMNKCVKNFQYAFTMFSEAGTEMTAECLQRKCQSHPVNDSALPYRCKEILNYIRRHSVPRKQESSSSSYQYVVKPLPPPPPTSYQAAVDCNVAAAAVPSTTRYDYHALEERSPPPTASYRPTSASRAFEMQRSPNDAAQMYFAERAHSPSSSYPPLKYIIENNITHHTSHTKFVEGLSDNVPPPQHRHSPVDTTHQSSSHHHHHHHVKNTSHRLVTTESSSSSSFTLLKGKTKNHHHHHHRSHCSSYSSDAPEFSCHATTHPLQVPNAQVHRNPSYYGGSPVNVPSDNSVPFGSPNLSVINAVPNSPSLSDCSIPSLVETIATAVPEHALLDDSLEAVNAAHNLMMISNRHRYNTSGDALHADPAANGEIISNTAAHVKQQLSTTTTEPPNDQQTAAETVHISRRKKKKKHQDKKKDKKKKAKRSRNVVVAASGLS
ncbi:uncharacterized protein LOC126834896 isoform X2 [Adelges cooleyi]|uniref:uncharacterized protein LOC126834896 isoform X2 n=1 Tax=Adelges cooleyi TaxID=133065 RepID=UPI00217F7CB0|nr:uncharacterized protein LOC126834896 isoform X2 [Adelges cooleyi]